MLAGLEDINVWARIESLFTRIDIEKLGPEDVQFHFAMVQYWLFFAFAYLGFALVYNRKLIRSAYLMFVSLFFYWKVGAPFLWILIFSTVVDFYLGRAVYRARSDIWKKWFIAFSLISNLGLLAYFKYFKFIATNWNDIRGLPDWMHIAHPEENAIGLWLNGQFNGDIFLDSLPMVVGISFYTFQTMSYSIDIYRGHIKPLKNIIDFGFFVSFFPQLVAGPIVRASEFVPQIHKDFQLTKKDFGWAIYMILKGLIKKMVFADYLAAYFLDDVFANPDEFSGTANLLAIIGYTLQIYGDFSGYSDMAIGIAKLMGFQLPENFRSPYKAINCGEFWKRWHLTLSRWLKDYLYIPLGGNKKASLGSYIVSGLIIFGVLYAVNDLLVTYISLAILLATILLAWYYEDFRWHINRNINILLTMLLGGLWHGSSWQFVIWGGLNGVGVLSTKYWLKAQPLVRTGTALMIGVFFWVVQIATGHPIWFVAVAWCSVVALVSFGKHIYNALGGKPWKTWYLNAMWGMIHTTAFITFTRIYFRGETMDKIDQFYNQLWYDFKLSFGETWIYASDKTENFIEYPTAVFWVMAAGFLVHWVPSSIKNRIETAFITSPIPVQLATSVVAVVLCYQAYSAEAPAFIYFQF